MMFQKRWPYPAEWVFSNSKSISREDRCRIWVYWQCICFGLSNAARALAGPDGSLLTASKPITINNVANRKRISLVLQILKQKSKAEFRFSWWQENTKECRLIYRFLNWFQQRDINNAKRASQLMPRWLVRDLVSLWGRRGICLGTPFALPKG